MTAATDRQPEPEKPSRARYLGKNLRFFRTFPRLLH